jgi:hypothetical protein
LIEHKSIQEYYYRYLLYAKNNNYTFFFHPSMFILKLTILRPHLHSFAFKSKQVTSLHKSLKSVHGMTSYNNIPTIENILFFSTNTIEVYKFWNYNACNWRLYGLQYWSLGFFSLKTFKYTCNQKGRLIEHPHNCCWIPFDRMWVIPLVWYRQTYNFLIKVHIFCTPSSAYFLKAGAHPPLPKTHYQNSYSHHFDARIYRLRSPSVPLPLPYLIFLCSPPLRSKSCLPAVANVAEDNQQPAIL